MTHAVHASTSPDHRTIALYLASRPGATYKDVAAELRQDPRTILRWLTAALQDRAIRPSAATPARLGTLR